VGEACASENVTYVRGGFINGLIVCSEGVSQVLVRPATEHQSVVFLSGKLVVSPLASEAVFIRVPVVVALRAWIRD
jgi:hypothetical protein